MALRFALFERLFRRMYAGAETAAFPGGARAQLAYVAPLALTRLAAIGNQRLDKLIVGLFFSATAFADVAIGGQELPLVTLLPYSIASLLLPRMTAARDREGPRAALAVWHAGIRKATLVMLPVAIFLLLAAEPLLVTLYGAEYGAAALPFRVYTALLPLRVTSYGVALMAFGRTREVLHAQLWGLAVSAGAAFFFLRSLGVIGAPIAAVTAQAAMIAFLLWRLRAAAGVSLAELFPFRHYAKTMAAALAAALVVGSALAGTRAGSPGLRVALAGALFASIYVFAATRFGALEAADRAFVRRWLRLEPLRARAPEKAAEPLLPRLPAIEGDEPVRLLAPAESQGESLRRAV